MYIHGACISIFTSMLLALFSEFLTQFTRYVLKNNNSNSGKKHRAQHTKKIDDGATYALKMDTKLKNATDKVHFTFLALCFC